MIKILASLLEENISIIIEDGDILVKTKSKDIEELVKSIYSEVLASYGPADGSFGGVIAQELVGVGAKIIELIEPPNEDGVVY